MQSAARLAPGNHLPGWRLPGLPGGRGVSIPAHPPLARGTLPQVWAMTLVDLAVWAGEAVELYKALYGARRR